MDQEIIKAENEEFSLERELAKIPDQMAFKIGDVAELLGVKQYVLRYWEQEFKALNPKKAVNNQRIYSRRDVETVILIKKFLYVDQFSIPGARKALKEFRERQQLQKAQVLMQPSLDTKSIESSALNSQNLSSLSPSLESNSAELLTEKYIKIEESITQLISKIKSVKGKLEHKFHQIGL